MKRLSIILTGILAAFVMAACGNAAADGNVQASETVTESFKEEESQTDTSRETEEVLTSSAPESSETSPVSEVPSVKQPTAVVTGVWDCIVEADGETYILRFTFEEDGTVVYAAGWYMSEWAGFSSGTYTVEGNLLTVDLTSEEDGSQLHSVFAVSLQNGELALTLESGDMVTYVQEVGDTLVYTVSEE